MTHHYVELHETGQFPKLLIDYLNRKPEITPYYAEYPTVEKARDVIERRTGFGPDKRRLLVKALEKQYAGLPGKPDFSLLLKETTFTVTTGHQLNIFTGPLYVIYKIITTINLARLLKLSYPAYDFVPVYWMASEDHDFQEIASVNLLGRRYKWNGEHTGAVGRLNPAELAPILDMLPEPLPLFSRAYLENKTLADAVRQYMHELFGAAGLISLDADCPELKRQFLPVIREELLHGTSGKLVQETTRALEKMGYQTPVNAREINLFYMTGHQRERIVQKGDGFGTTGSTRTFTQEELLAEAETHPEHFSPNVVLRPLYQEILLPNLAYIGGPSEIPYWMQLKAVFDHFNTSFPLLVPRNFALYVTAAEKRRLGKLGLSVQELFGDREALKKKVIEKFSEHDLDVSKEKEAFEAIFQSIYTKAGAVDKTMEAAVLAEKARLVKSLAKLEKRILKAEERNQGIVLGQLQHVLQSFFPEGVPQERYHNFLEFQLKNSQFIPDLFRCFDPLDFRFNILMEN